MKPYSDTLTGRLRLRCSANFATSGHVFMRTPWFAKFVRTPGVLILAMSVVTRNLAQSPLGWMRRCCGEATKRRPSLEIPVQLLYNSHPYGYHQRPRCLPRTRSALSARLCRSQARLCKQNWDLEVLPMQGTAFSGCPKLVRAPQASRNTTRGPRTRNCA